MDVRKVLELINSAEQKKETLTEGKNMAKDMVMQHYTKQEIKSPIKNPVSRINEYLKVVDNEMLNVIKEEQDAKRIEVKKIVGRVLERLDESKKVDAPKPRNFVAKNAKTAGAGAHKDKKKAEKQGDIKHKKNLMPMDESEQLDEKAVSKAQQKFMGMVHAAKKGEKPASKAVAKVAKGMSAKAAKDYASTKHKGLPDKKVDEEKKKGTHGKACWDGYRRVGQNDCVKVGETIEVGSPVRVYSNVLKKPVYGVVVELRENRAYVNYLNTKIVMGHPITKVQLSEAAAAAVAPAAAGIGSKLARFIPGVGLVAGGYDAYQRAKQGDYTGAALSAGAGLAGLVPGVGTALSTGLIGAQLGRDKARTGSFLPSYDEIGAAGKKPAQGTTPAPAGGSWPTTPDAIKAFQKANKDKDGKPLVVDGLIGAKTYQAMIKAGMKPPANFAVASYKPQQAATPAPKTAAAAPAAAAAGQTPDAVEPATVNQAPAAAASGAGTTKTTNTRTSVSGTIKMGKPEGPIEYNGKTVNPGDPEYTAASQALMAQQGRIQQARQNMRPGANRPAPVGNVTQGASQELDRDF